MRLRAEVRLGQAGLAGSSGSNTRFPDIPDVGRSCHHKAQRGDRGGDRWEQKHLGPGSVALRLLSRQGCRLLKEEKGGGGGDKHPVGALGHPPTLM